MRVVDIATQRIVQIIHERLLRFSDSLIHRYAICTLHFLALNRPTREVLVEGGTYEFATQMGNHTDQKIKDAARAVLRLLADNISTVGEGTAKKLIAVCSIEQSETGQRSSEARSPTDVVGEECSTWDQAAGRMQATMGSLVDAMPPGPDLPFVEMASRPAGKGVGLGVKASFPKVQQELGVQELHCSDDYIEGDIDAPC